MCITAMRNLHEYSRSTSTMPKQPEFLGFGLCVAGLPKYHRWAVKAMLAIFTLDFGAMHRMLLRCGVSIGVDLPLPSLGVSSLDLGRLGSPSGPFSFPAFPIRPPRPASVARPRTDKRALRRSARDRP